MSKEPINDRIGEYLIPYISEYVFDNLSEAYLERAGVKDLLLDVPVPIKKTELADLTNLKIARSMAMVIGCDVNFPHRDKYVEYINRTFGDSFALPLLNEGVEMAAGGNPEKACIMFRGVIAIAPNNPDGYYCYGRACKDAYENGEGEEYVGRFKAESLEAFEKMTLIAPKDERGYYFLGYAYLNLGLYMKARLTFEEYIKLADVIPEETAGIPEEELNGRQEAIEEIKDWINRLEGPVEIERGYNHVLAGRYEEGIRVLTPYTEEKRYKDWWPLYFYLGSAYKGLEEYDEAISCFTKVLKYAPSDIATMEELIQIYAARNEEEMVEKYKKKIQVVKRNMEEEKAERDTSYS